VLVPAEATLAPNQSSQINIVIDVPSDALPGGHYAMILHEPSLSRNGKTESAAAVAQRVGTLLYVIVDGPINEEAYLRNISIPEFSEYGPVPISLTVDNQSDIHIRPQIGIEIRNVFGQKVETLNLESKNIFPISSREFTTTWDRIWGIGPYQASIIMSYGSGGQVAQVKQWFWLIPIKLLLAALIIVLSSVAIFVSIRRHLVHKADLSAQKIKALEEKLQQIESQQ
jgi:hypothetical protein